MFGHLKEGKAPTRYSINGTFSEEGEPSTREANLQEEGAFAFPHYSPTHMHAHTQNRASLRVCSEQGYNGLS